MMRYCVRRR